MVDIGCGTGVLACRLAAQGCAVTGVDPAAASLNVAARRAGGDRVRWVHGVASSVVPLAADLVVMSGNVAQVFVDDDSWSSTLRAARSVLGPEGHLLFETRVPARRGWEQWTPERSRSTADTVEGPVESWVEVTGVDPPLVSFRWTYRFLEGGPTLTSDSTLRFRGLDEIENSLERAGFTICDLRDAPDRPGQEWIVLAETI